MEESEFKKISEVLTFDFNDDDNAPSIIMNVDNNNPCIHLTLSGSVFLSKLKEFCEKAGIKELLITEMGNGDIVLVLSNDDLDKDSIFRFDD